MNVNVNVDVDELLARGVEENPPRRLVESRPDVPVSDELPELSEDVPSVRPSTSSRSSAVVATGTSVETARVDVSLTLGGSVRPCDAYRPWARSSRASSRRAASSGRSSRATPASTKR